MWIVDDWYDWWRLINAVLCAYALFTLRNLHFPRNDRRRFNMRGLWIAVVGWTVTGLASSFEGIVTDAPLGIRVGLVTICVVLTINITQPNPRRARR